MGKTIYKIMHEHMSKCVSELEENSKLLGKLSRKSPDVEVLSTMLIFNECSINIVI